MGGDHRDDLIASPYCTFLNHLRSDEDTESKHLPRAPQLLTPTSQEIYAFSALSFLFVLLQKLMTIRFTRSLEDIFQYLKRPGATSGSNHH